jgi:hypothetical protein
MNTELLQENRSLGFANAESAPPHFAARICEIRSAILEKRPVPGPSRDFIEGAERRSALATPAARRVNTLPASMLTETLQQTIDRQARQIRADREAMERAAKVREMLTDFSAVGQDNFRHYVEDRVQGGQPATPDYQMRCGSMSSSADDHAWGTSAHCVLARKAFDDGDRSLAERHYEAAECHRAVGSPDTPDYQVRIFRAVAACQATTEKDDE